MLPSHLRCPELVYVSFFILFYHHLCSFFCLFVSVGLGNMGREKEPPFSSPATKRQEKEKDHETDKRGFEEEPSPGVRLLEGHVPHPTNFKVHPNLHHQKTFLK